MTEKILFETTVGSHMWGMNTPESDLDQMVIFQQPTKDMLYGHILKTSKEHKEFIENDVEYDYQYMEIGHLIGLLLKGNVNAIWTVTTPIYTTMTPELWDLRIITFGNLSRSSYASIKGMAISQFKDSTRRKIAQNMNPDKAYKTCLRTLKFGIKLFNDGSIMFAPVDRVPTKEEIDEAFDELGNAYEESDLPDQPKEKPFRDFLYDVRMSELI
jgi:predicted nucleotidyltransferase